MNDLTGMKIDGRRGELNIHWISHEFPTWVGRVDDAWKFYVRSFIDTGMQSFRNLEACESRWVDGNKYVLWHTTWHGIAEHCLEKVTQTDKWYHLRGNIYGRSSYLSVVPSVVPLCPRCAATKKWVNAATLLGVEPIIPMCIENVEEFHNFSSSFDPFNRYIFALKDIYFSHFGVSGMGCTLKTLDRRVLLRGRVRTIIGDMLALGIVVLKPSTSQKKIYVEYNEEVDIADALEVLSWYGKLHL